MGETRRPLEGVKCVCITMFQLFFGPLRKKLAILPPCQIQEGVLPNPSPFLGVYNSSHTNTSPIA